MVFLQQFLDSNLYRVELGAERGAFPRHLAASTRAESSPDISPDGSRIAFASNRTGSFEIWLIDADGGNPTQLTDLRHRWLSSLVLGWPANRVFGPAIDRRPIQYLRRRRVHRRDQPDHVRTIEKINGPPGPPTANPSTSCRTGVARCRSGGCQRPAATRFRSQETVGSRPGNRAMGSFSIIRTRRARSGECRPRADSRRRTARSSSAFRRMTAWGGEWVLTKAGIYWLNYSAPRPAVEFFRVCDGA